MSFDARPIRQRVAIVLAGPLFNLLLAVLLFAMSVMVGMPSIRAVVAEVLPGSPAAMAGLLPGEEIVAVEGEMLTGGLSEMSQVLLRHALRGEEHVVLGTRPVMEGSGRQAMADVVTEKLMPVGGIDVDAATRGELLLQSGIVPWLPQPAVLGEIIAPGPASAAVMSDSSVGMRAWGQDYLHKWQ